MNLEQEYQEIMAQKERDRLRAENDTLHTIIAKSGLDCVFCGLPKEDMAKCTLGFPGCSRADYIITGMTPEEWDALDNMVDNINEEEDVSACMS